MTKKMNDMIGIIELLNKNQANTLMNLMKGKKFTDEQIKSIEKRHAGKDMRTFVSAKKQKSFAFQIYEQQVNKILHIISNKKLVEKVSGIKILLHGETGTGKTSVANILLDNVGSGYEYKEIHFENLISYKMGQTQMNIIKLSNEIVLESKNKKMIIFLDEIDSIISNRGINNDVAEYSRIVATFIKFIDSMNSNVIFIAATNILSSIDPAITRRFNVNIEGKKFGIKTFIEFLDKEGYEVPKRKFSKIIDNEYQFKISQFNSFVNNFDIEISLYKELDIFTYFTIYFEKELSIDRSKLSQRTLLTAKKSGLLNE